MNALIDGFEYDVFISYARADNQKFSNQQFGWVEQFLKDLTIQVHRTHGAPPKIWQDKRNIDGTQVFDDTIAAGVKNAAILVCLFSRSYLASPYCKQELSTFYERWVAQQPGLQLGDRFRIVNVLLQDIPHQEWPREFAGRTGFPFYKKKNPDDLGDPLHIEHDNETYLDQLQQLGHAVSKVLQSFPKAIPVLPAAAPGIVAAAKKFSIYFGEVVDTLDDAKTRAIAELESKGFDVQYNIPPPFEAAPHDEAVTQMVKNCDLTVHLLEAYPGKQVYKGDGSSYAQKQADIGLNFGKRQFIWVPKELNALTVEKESYKSFLADIESGNHNAKNLEYIRGERSLIVSDLLAHAAELKAQYDKALVQDRFSILLDTHYKDQQYALELSKTLLENQICPYIDPQSDDPQENIDILKIRIGKVKKLVFFYGQVAQDWLEERITTTLKLLLDNKYPRKEFFVILLPPQKSPEQTFLEQSYLKINVIDNSKQSQLDPGVYKQLL